MQQSDVRSLLTDMTGTNGAARPRHFATRFDASGHFLPDPGNTVVLHVVPGSTTERALIEVRRRLMALPYAHHFTFTPVPSLHMTLIQGVLHNRRKEHYWPNDLALDAPVATVTDLYLERLADFEHRGAFTMVPESMTPLGLTLMGATSEDTRVLQTWRDDLTERLGYRHPDHDDYVFHITLAYQVDWLPKTAVDLYDKALASCLAHMRSAAPKIELGDIEFCTFEDMKHFEPLQVLRPRPEAGKGI